ncbi:MAG: hypothetical protein ACTSXL_02540 [Alphaproteobacteria bacterium]
MEKKAIVTKLRKKTQPADITENKKQEIVENEMLDPIKMIISPNKINYLKVLMYVNSEILDAIHHNQNTVQIDITDTLSKEERDEITITISEIQYMLDMIGTSIQNQSKDLTKTDSIFNDFQQEVKESICSNPNCPTHKMNRKKDTVY